MKKIITRVTDDLDGSEGAQEVEFGLDGVRFTIDLAERNAAVLRSVLAPYIAVAQKVGRQPAITSRQPRTTLRSSREQNQAIREWAARNGHELANRGRIPEAIVEAFNEAA